MYRATSAVRVGGLSPAELLFFFVFRFIGVIDDVVERLLCGVCDLEQVISRKAVRVVELALVIGVDASDGNVERTLMPWHNQRSRRTKQPNQHINGPTLALRASIRSS